MNFRRFNFKRGKGEDPEAVERINRIVYIVAVCLLIGIVVLAAFTSAANRARKPVLTTGGDVTTSVPDVTTKNPDDVTTPSDTGVSGDVPVLMLPVDGVLGMSHDEDLQVFSQTMGDYRVHTGIDIICDEGAAVYAAADGTVSRVYEDPMMGYSVAVKHIGGVTTVYQNLSPVHASGISEGSSIKAGQLIGSVGDSALLELAEEAHLHFGVFYEDEHADPFDYLSEAAVLRLKG